MSKRQKQKEKKRAGNNNIPGNRLIYGIFILFAFILYGQTLSYDYALDDSIVIKKNEFTKKGVAGIPDILTNDTFVGFFGKKKNLVAGGRYRPLSLVTFAIEVELFGLRPGISHFINILLYALTVILIFNILTRLFRDYQTKFWYFSIPFLTSLIYLAHPIHTEVVANIKGRDEIMTLLGSLLAMWYTLKYLDFKKLKYLLYSFIAFFLAFLSKENTITFLAIIPFAVVFFTHHKLKDTIVAMVPLLVASIIFLIIRQNILGSFSTPVARELMNNPFLNASGSEKYASIFYTLLLYLKLLIFPHPLTYDYYPKQIPIIGWDDWRAITSLLIYIALLVIASIGLYKALFKNQRNNVIAFSIWFFLASLSVVSNLVFPVGTFMNERFIFISSFSFALILAWLISEKLRLKIENLAKYKRVASILVVILLFSYTVKSVTRNTAWKDDPTLFTTDVETSTESAKGNAAAAAIYRERAEKSQNPDERKKNYELAIKHFSKATEIYPEYFDVYLDLGVIHYQYNKNLEACLKNFKHAWEINPDNPKLIQFSNAIFNELKDPAKKLSYFSEINKKYPGKYEVLYTLGAIYGKEYNQLDSAVSYLNQAVQVNPKGSDALKDLGVAYGMLKQYEKSIEMSTRALKFKPRDAQIYVNIGINYRSLGNEAKAMEYFNTAASLDPKYKQLQTSNPQ